MYTTATRRFGLKYYFSNQIASLTFFKFSDYLFRYNAPCFFFATFNNCNRLFYVLCVQWLLSIVNYSFHIRKCLLLLTVFQVAYISSILFRVPCRVNSGGKVKRYDIETIMRSNIEKLYFSRCFVVSYLRYFLQRSNNYQLFCVCFFTCIQCKE